MGLVFTSRRHVRRFTSITRLTSSLGILSWLLQRLTGPAHDFSGRVGLPLRWPLQDDSRGFLPLMGSGWQLYQRVCVRVCVADT